MRTARTLSWGYFTSSTGRVTSSAGSILVEMVFRTRDAGTLWSEYLSGLTLSAAGG